MRLVVILILCFKSSFVKAELSNPFEIYVGKYKLSDGRHLIVNTNNNELMVEIDRGSLLEFADIRADSRVVAIEKKTAELFNATISKDRKRIAELFITSPIDMDDYIDGHFDILEPALALKPKLNEFDIISTSYRDEDSEYGYGDASWGWETFTKFSDGKKDVIVRIVWDGVSGHNAHRGTGKFPIIKNKLSFKPRMPSRSWIRVYSPETQKTQMLRELPREIRKNTISARFVAYDIDTHNTVGIRFRKPEKEGEMTLEIGPLGSDVITSAKRVEAGKSI